MPRVTRPGTPRRARREGIAHRRSPLACPHGRFVRPTDEVRPSPSDLADLISDCRRRRLLDELCERGLVLDLREDGIGGGLGLPLPRLTRDRNSKLFEGARRVAGLRVALRQRVDQVLGARVDLQRLLLLGDGFGELAVLGQLRRLLGEPRRLAQGDASAAGAAP